MILSSKRVKKIYNIIKVLSYYLLFIHITSSYKLSHVAHREHAMRGPAMAGQWDDGFTSSRGIRC
jgi:hypothetical protein